MDHDLELLYIAAPYIPTEGVRDLLLEIHRMRRAVAQGDLPSAVDLRDTITLAGGTTKTRH